MTLSEDEKTLYEQLVVWLTIRMSRSCYGLPPELQRPCDDGIHTKGAGVQHDSMSAFEAACGVLLSFGIAVPLGANLEPMTESGRPCGVCRITHDVPEIRRLLQDEPGPVWPGLADVVLAFLRVTTEFEGVPTPRGPFNPPGGFDAIFQSLVRCGYAEAAGGGVRWTLKMAPQMRALYAWDDENDSREEFEQTEVDRMWRTLPIKVRRAFFTGGPVDVLSLAMVVETFWVDGEWRYIDRVGRASDSALSGPNSLSRARELVRRHEASIG